MAYNTQGELIPGQPMGAHNTQGEWDPTLTPEARDGGAANNLDVFAPLGMQKTYIKEEMTPEEWATAKANPTTTYEGGREDSTRTTEHLFFDTASQKDEWMTELERLHAESTPQWQTAIKLIAAFVTVGGAAAGLGAAGAAGAGGGAGAGGASAASVAGAEVGMTAAEISAAMEGIGTAAGTNAGLSTGAMLGTSTGAGVTSGIGAAGGIAGAGAGAIAGGGGTAAPDVGSPSLDPGVTNPSPTSVPPARTQPGVNPTELGMMDKYGKYIPSALSGISSVYNANQAEEASREATAAKLAAQGEQLGYLREVEKLPLQYRDKALQQMGDYFTGDADAQQALIDKAKASPFYQSLISQGEEGVMRNASMTGGLRSGNVQDALYKTNANILSGVVDKQLQGTSVLARTPLNTNQIGSTIGAMGTTEAQGTIAQGQIQQQGMQGLTDSIGAGLSQYYAGI